MSCSIHTAWHNGQCKRVLVKYILCVLTLDKCPPFYSYPTAPPDCCQADQAGVALHELSHINGILGEETYFHSWDDWAIKDPEREIDNADGFRLFAQGSSKFSVSSWISNEADVSCSGGEQLLTILDPKNLV